MNQKFPAAAALIVAAFAALPATAGEIVVKVTGMKSASGEIGCALFSARKGFPLDTAGAAKLEWQPADRRGVTCRFTSVEPSQYAVAVVHDLNGNHRTDTKMFGIPTEDWGVSNNIRPRLRAPNFDEAAFSVAEGKTVAIEITVSR